MWSTIDGSWKFPLFTEATSICFQIQTCGWSSLPRNPLFPFCLSVQKSSRTVTALFHKSSLCVQIWANGCAQLLTAPLNSRTTFKGSLDWSWKTSWDPQCEGWRFHVSQLCGYRRSSIMLLFIINLRPFYHVCNCMIHFPFDIQSQWINCHVVEWCRWEVVINCHLSWGGFLYMHGQQIVKCILLLHKSQEGGRYNYTLCRDVMLFQ